ncbi:hypothetical protein LDENG_00226400 [Lucifuga dentata]|nr:hypothetical protein LDENG_00226400 [Lucifuga dentata]
MLLLPHSDLWTQFIILLLDLSQVIGMVLIIAFYIERLVGPLSERREKTLLPIYYIAIIESLPSYISSLLHWSSGPYLTYSSDWLTLQASHIHTGLGKTAFNYAALVSWNKLQCSLKLKTLLTVGQFKS